MKKSAYTRLSQLQNNYWWFRGMRNVNKFLLDTAVSSKGLILDVGCGAGGELSMLRRYGTVVGLDISQTALELARKNGGQRLVSGSALALPFKRGSFDLVVALDVLYHAWIGDVEKSLTELTSLLRPGGMLLLRLPAYDWLRRKHDDEVMTARRFTKRQVIAMLPDELRIERASYVNMFLFPLVVMSSFSQQNDLRRLPGFINWLLGRFLLAELLLLHVVNLPFGSSILLLARKK